MKYEEEKRVEGWARKDEGREWCRVGGKREWGSSGVTYTTGFARETEIA